MVLDKQIVELGSADKGYPALLLQASGVLAPTQLWAAGPLDILQTNKTALFCSTQCPGGVILKTFDTITTLRDNGQTLIGGFHSPMELECLGILLRGRQPVIWVPARSIHGMHLKPELQPAFSSGRLLILSPFPAQHKRITAALADGRNRVVGAIADRIFVAHAAPGSKTLALCHELHLSGKPLLTLDDPANTNLLSFAAPV